MLQTIHKVGSVLDLFTVERPEWRLAEAAAALSLPRSSAHALLSSLVQIGVLESRDRGRYRVGWRIVELGETLRATVNVRTIAYPFLERLVEEYGETSHLAIMERSRVLYIDKIVGTHMVNVVGARVGTQLEPHCSAVGKVLLAHLGRHELDRILGRLSFRRFTATTITTRAAMVDELAAVRQDGVAYDRGEAVSDVHCVAAPIRDGMGVVVAAVSMTVPVSRFSRSQAELTRAVRSVASDIASQLATAENVPVPAPVGDPTAQPDPAH
jgi:DNA-binding IclR family transcriptional regulator